MRKQSGFIATSILYTFFLVFLALFVSLIANYVHNKLLLAKINESAKKKVAKINKTELKEMNVGEKIKFATSDSDHLLNSDAVWTLAYISGDNKYYFLSDLSAQKNNVYIQYGSDSFSSYHSMTLDLYENIKSNHPEYYYNAFKVQGKFTISIPTNDLIALVRNNSSINEDIKDSILNPGGEYVVQINTSGTNYGLNEYYVLRTYTFSATTPQSTIKSYCGGYLNGTTVSYDANNVFGYIHTVKKTVANPLYVNYCYYASYLTYNHYRSEGVVDIDEIGNQDLVVYKYNANTPIRLMAVVSIDSLSEQRIAGGRGTKADPYLFVDGKQ